MPSLVPRSGPSLIGRDLGTRLACTTPSKGNLKRFRGIKLQIYVNACGVKNRYGNNGNVPIAMAQILFSHAWCMGSGNKSRPRLLPRSFLVLTLGAGGGASESSFPILKVACSGNQIGNVQIGNLEIRNV